MASTLNGLETLTCPHSVVDRQNPIKEALSRWSDAYTTHPAIVLNPKNEDDISLAISFVKANRLRILPAGGGHGTFVFIDSKTAYLDLKSFKSIQLDRAAGTVTIGAACTTGELLRYLAGEGYYTPLPNSNAVGVIGCIIGGGNTNFNGLHGFMVDNAVGFRVVTSKGDVVDVSSSSEGDELALFHALCGAGHGLGVITAATIRVYPIGDLGLPEGKLWTRTLLFPPPALGDVADVFSGLKPLDGRLNVVLTFLRGPPGTPAAGKPIMIFTATFFGPSEEAEKAASALFDEGLVQKAIKADTVLVPLADMNNALEPANAHGGYKSIASTRLNSLTSEALKQSFNLWVGFTEGPSTGRTSMTFQNFNATRLQENGSKPEHAGKFLEARDRGSNAMVIPWATTEEAWDGVAKFEKEFLETVRTGGNAPWTMVNNMRVNGELRELFGRERLGEVQRVKGLFDPEGVFWSPFERAQ